MDDEDSNHQPSIDHDISEEEGNPDEYLDDEMDAADGDEEPPSNSIKGRSSGGDDEPMPTSSQDGDEEGDDTRHGMDNDDDDNNDDDDESIPDRPPSSKYVEYTGEGSESPSLKNEKHESITATPSSAAFTLPSSAPPPHQQQQSTGPKICPVDSTLWMSDLKEEWDTEFIKKAFESFGYIPINIKHITERVKLKPYAFVEFETAEIAKKAILKCNGRSIPGDPDKHKFRLSFANLPNQIINEYIVAVGNLSSTVDDAALFKLFGTKYVSCRGAKVHVNPDGTPKRSGIIKFSNQTDQQLAVIEMNKYEFKGREIRLRLGPTKQRGPKNLLSTLQPPMMFHHQQQQGVYGQQAATAGFMPGLFPPPGQQFPNMNPMFGVTLPYSSSPVDAYRLREHRNRSPDRDRRRRSHSRDGGRHDKDHRYHRGRSDHRERERSPGRRRRSRSRDRKRRAKDLDDYVTSQRGKELFIPTYFPSYVQDNKPWDVNEYNEEFINQSEDCLTALESSKWSDFFIPTTWKQEDIIKQLYPEALVDA